MDPNIAQVAHSAYVAMQRILKKNCHKELHESCIQINNTWVTHSFVSLSLVRDIRQLIFHFPYAKNEYPVAFLSIQVGLQ